MQLGAKDMVVMGKTDLGIMSTDPEIQLSLDGFSGPYGFSGRRAASGFRDGLSKGIESPTSSA